jgi:hypothetical protein
LELVLDLLVAIGTIGAVLVALFGQAFRSKFFPPKLKVALDDPRGHKTPVSLIPPPGSGQEPRTEEAFYFHVRVSNLRRWSPATQVRVDLLRVEAQETDGTFKVQWTGEIPLVWRHQPLFPPTRTIGPDAIADLCSVVRGKWLELHTQIAPLSLDTKRRGAATIIATLQARSTECESNVLAVRISWNGEWSESETELRRHLTVKPMQTKDVERPAA